ncbi:MAG: NUDIX domain-containing protein [Lachnospiraceae bacterium]|nr:NUDIX domain-containing protein [Lachnospiraceae bacterium]
MVPKYDLDIHYRTDPAENGDLVLLYPSGKTLMRPEENGFFSLPAVSEVKEAYPGLSSDDFTYLFAVAGVRYYTLLDAEVSEFGNFTLSETRVFRGLYPRDRAFAATLGNQLYYWYRKNLYCGACGSKTVRTGNERAIRCPHCGNLIFPRINPSVIIGILHQGRLLVTRYSPNHQMMGNAKTEKPTVNYALVAGYVEAGETPEETVRRECMEEVGLKVKNLRFFDSQAWPFTSSLLFGFFCEVDGDDTITLEQDELSAALFLKPEEMPDRSGEISLTSNMMEAFRTGQIR